VVVLPQASVATALVVDHDAAHDRSIEEAGNAEVVAGAVCGRRSKVSVRVADADGRRAIAF